MGRTARNRDVQHPKPVEKIELSEKHIGLRFALVVVLLVVAVAAFTYGVNSLFSVESGWTEIEADASAETNVANEFVLMYNLGSRTDMSITAEQKGIIALYTEFMERAYQIFHNQQGFENVNNIYYINRHPNQEIVVDDMLYQAFSLVKEYENRNIYLGPVYAVYDDIFYCEDDSQIAAYDPYTNSAVADSYKEIADYASNNEMVDVQLLGENKIKLFVSDSYLAYAKENDIVDFIGFSWMKNAFVIDALAEVLIENGYEACTISSYDGFIRNLDDSDVQFSLNLFAQTEGTVYQAATMNYQGTKSFVSMRDFPINSLDKYSYYALDNGEIRSLYLDIKDGLCKSSTDSLYVYASDVDCSQLMLEAIPIYISDNMDITAVETLKEKQIYSIYIDEKEISYNEENISLDDINQY